MKTFTKLALATAVAAAASSSFALQSMTDADMGATTGKDGISISITPGNGGITIEKVLVHDNDGFGGSNDAGAIVLGDATTNGLTITGGNISLDIDADGNAGSPYLNVAATIGGGTITVGDVYVADSNVVAGPYTGANQRGATADTKILNGFNFTSGDITANIQLGNQPQGAMALISSTVTDGITISGLGITDNNGGTSTNQGTLQLGSLTVTDAAGPNLTIDASLNIDGGTAGGTDAAIQIVDNSGSKYMYITDLQLLDQNYAVSNTIGDIEIVGLNTGGATISVSGH